MIVISKFRIILSLALIFGSVLSFSQAFGQAHEENEVVEIPEPLMFDLVRGLGARKGELEINSLVDFPLQNFSERGVEWAPEIEYALFNGFAVELEFPLNNFELEAYKVAVQWTIGDSKNGKFIHGLQVLGEGYIHDDIFELNFLYVPAYRFNHIWSAIALVGLMVESGAESPDQNTTILLNASVFANLKENMVVGVEFNNTNPGFQEVDDNEMELLILPQFHYEWPSGLSVQAGLGPRFNDGKTNGSGVLRVIKTF